MVFSPAKPVDELSTGDFDIMSYSARRASVPLCAARPKRRPQVSCTRAAGHDEARGPRTFANDHVATDATHHALEIWK